MRPVQKCWPPLIPSAGATDQFLHVDGSIPSARGEGMCDILAMICVRPAAEGGASKLASAAEIYARLQEKPALLKIVERGFKYDAQSVEYHPDWRQPARGDRERPMAYQDANGRPCIQYAKNMVETIMAVYRGTPDEEEVRTALAELEEVCSDTAVVQHWDLTTGEAYLVDNYRWLHARTAFVDDTQAPRLFFRLWLQVPDFNARDEQEKTGDAGSKNRSSC
ncbi:unnamed protein product [Symbiodinium natans]|uniref:TauD/TfdA-like domain-containing protein n=1 Tax=Symbiodinium natans TaxID=878477 RepID=A0A812JIN9_9DINO|nr:unnamed protein product [Symbiodinium natans]